ncbi:globin domain-containing protein [Rhodoblastus sp.]|uniref:globin domain-containing protein n=1 Tax=Rhodoblastus sp. TaxID=1962975 RepID=UPI003F9A550A
MAKPMSRDWAQELEKTLVDEATAASRQDVSENEWWYIIGGQEVGPVTKGEVASQITSHGLSPNSFIWRNGMASWAQLGEVDDFSHFLRLRAERDQEPSTREEAKVTASTQAKPADAGAGAPGPEAPKQAANVAEPQKAQPAITAANAPKPAVAAGGAEQQQTKQNPFAPANKCPMPKAFTFSTERKEAEKVSRVDNGDDRLGVAPSVATPDMPATSEEPKKPSLLPGSDGEHKIQEKYDSKARAINFYEKQMLSYLAPRMKEFIARQEFLFVATADRHGECDCTSKFGKPGFIRVLSDNYLIYPEYRGNGVYANTGNMSENPHIAMLMIDFTRDTIGLHVNGKVRVVENDELRRCTDKLPADVIEEINQEGKKCPERWVMVEVEEAYIQCSKHIPLLKKADKAIDWGTDNAAAKGGDYFQLLDIPLYHRLGGDKAMDVVVDLFYRKVLEDELVGKFFDDVDMDSQRLKQKNFLCMAFGGPYQFSGMDLRKTHSRLVEKMGLTDVHFDRVMELFKESLEELHISKKELNSMVEILESAREDVLNR